MYELFPDPHLPARRRAASALRQLSEALVARDVDDARYDDIARWATTAAGDLDVGSPRHRAADYMHRRYTDPPPPDDRAFVTSSDRPVSGPANPSAVTMSMRRVGREARAEVVFDRRFESAPGRVHGGVLASVFDDIMGYIQVIEGIASYTMELTVRYRAPVATHVLIDVRARATERTERRCIVTAEAVARGATDVLADARGLFAVVPPERLDPPLTAPPG